jgi:hypothetical protein
MKNKEFLTPEQFEYFKKLEDENRIKLANKLGLTIKTKPKDEEPK